MLIPLAKCKIEQEPTGTIANLNLTTLITGPKIYSKCIQPLNINSNQVPK